MSLNESLSNDYLAKLAAADASTTDHFVRHYSALLQVKLRARMINTSEIDEIRQETFRRVLSAIQAGSIRDGARLNAYVIATCNNVVFEHFRHTSRLAPLDDSPNLPASENAEKDFLRAERLQRVRLILDKMTERDRQIVTALFIEERDKDDLCQQLGVNREYLRVLVHRALINLRQELGR